MRVRLPYAYAPATARLLAELLGAAFDPAFVAVVEGGRAENAALLEQRFDYIFFTGSVAVGKLVMEKAAASLTPVTLELGGKSPCVVTADCDIPLAAARLVFGKFLNCGQTCVAPDYVLVDRRVQDRLVAEIGRQITAMFGENPLKNPDYGHIVNKKHFDRLLGLMAWDKVVLGGQFCEAALQIAPTVLNNVTGDDALMAQEIFGPLLPILPYDTLEAAEEFIRRREKPLALYLFSNDRAVQQRFLHFVPFGGGCINDTVVHLATSHMGFGGVGHSGMGSYHGKRSFDTFSHEKSILKKAGWLDLPLRYQPYTRVKSVLIRMFLR
ncbi:MAG: aldehyde dehydrogenase family protein [Eubacteriales bacterium]|nr:aldehyde dehydrogenase family protein [Eubacteriales bacterium]